MKKGFTLIELLVVIAVIGLLASIVLVAVNSARAKARDVKRLSSMRQVQLALAMYYDDNNSYPVAAAFVGNCGGDTAWENLLGPALVKYMATIPSDPLFPHNPWPLCFLYKSGDYAHCTGTGHGYTILFASETTVFDLGLYGIQGEGGTAARYCLHEE